MRKDIREKMPSWVNEDGNNYQLCMSDDIDSLLSCKVLERVKGYKINYFYSFQKFYVMDSDNQKEAVGVDIALVNGKCWDNHVTLLSSRDSVNKQSANLNTIFKVSKTNYTKKYAGSTLLQVWSYYNLPLPESEEGKMSLLAIDMSKFKETQNEYLRMLGFEELIAVQEKHKQMDFQRISIKYGIKKQIIVNENNSLETELKLDEIGKILGFDLSLPEQQLSLMMSFEKGEVNTVGRKDKKSIKKKIFTLALTKERLAKFSAV